MLLIYILFIIQITFWSAIGHESLDDSTFRYGYFPDDFAWSSATSAYQIEGGWDADGKGRNIWDTFSATPGKIRDGSNGNVACDSYNNYKEDVQLLKALGVKYYRFSLSWARLLPTGDVANVNELGVDYYNSLIDELLAHGISPQITLYHWDLPQALADRGGWQNADIVDWFTDYANFSFTKFGDRVKFWITFNEPWIICLLGYTSGAHAPGIKDTTGTLSYICGRNLLLAHAKAYSVYDSTHRTSADRKCGITLNVGYSKANNTRDSSDLEAADRAMQFDLGWFAHPIFSSVGDYPIIMKQRIESRSRQQNLTESRLPAFNETEIQSIKGSSDFFGLNFYSGGNVVDNPHKDNPPTGDPNFWDDKGTSGGTPDPNWTPSGSSWLFSTPELMRAVLVWISREYYNPDVYVTENGFSDRTGQINDDARVNYYKFYINNVLQAINDDECNVKGYTAWSLMDNFEWGEGYVEKFGLNYVNFSDPARPRVAKDSARFYAKVISDNGFPAPPPTTSTAHTTTTTATTKSAASRSKIGFIVYVIAAVSTFSRRNIAI